jgi:hypothetical protein
MNSTVDRSTTSHEPPPGGTPLRVSAYDQVASLLIASLILVGFFVLLMFIVWLTSRLLFTQAPVPVEMLEYSGRGDHAAGFERDLEEPGMEEMEELNEPSLEATLEAVTDVVTSQAASFDVIATNAAATSRGKGMGDSRGPGPLGDGTDEIVPPWERWEIRFTSSGLDAYASQLDFFKIELGAGGGGFAKVDYARNLAKGSPDTRKGDPDAEKRLYMSWQKSNGALAAFDRRLLQRAGISTQGRFVLQFYSKELERQIFDVEYRYAAAQGHTDQREWLKTVFGVRAAGRGYEFYVIEQSYRAAPKT